MGAKLSIGSESTSNSLPCASQWMQSEMKLLHEGTASILSPGPCWMLTLVLIFSSQVKQGGPWTKINTFHDYNIANALHSKSFQFCSTFSPSEFTFPTIRFSLNFFQAFLGQQVADSHSKSYVVLTSPWQCLQTGQQELLQAKMHCCASWRPLWTFLKPKTSHCDVQMCKTQLGKGTRRTLRLLGMRDIRLFCCQCWLLSHEEFNPQHSALWFLMSSYYWKHEFLLIYHFLLSVTPYRNMKGIITGRVWQTSRNI